MSYNPYQVRSKTLPKGARTVQKRPSQLTFVAILAIVMGSFGLFSGFCGIGEMVFQNLVLDFTKQTARANPNQGGEMSVILDLSQEVGDKYLFLRIPVVIFGLIVATLLVTGGIGLNMNKIWSFMILKVAFSTAILNLIASLVVNTIIQLEIGARIEELRNIRFKQNPVIAHLVMIISGMFSMFKAIVYSVCIFIVSSKVARDWANSVAKDS